MTGTNLIPRPIAEAPADRAILVARLGYNMVRATRCARTKIWNVDEGEPGPALSRIGYEVTARHPDGKPSAVAFHPDIWIEERT